MVLMRPVRGGRGGGGGDTTQYEEEEVVEVEQCVFSTSGEKVVEDGGCLTGMRRKEVMEVEAVRPV